MRRTGSGGGPRPPLRGSSVPRAPVQDEAKGDHGEEGGGQFLRGCLKHSGRRVWPQVLLLVSGFKRKTCGLSRAPTRAGGGRASGPAGRGVAFVPEGGWVSVGLCLCACLCSRPNATPKSGARPAPELSRGGPLPPCPRGHAPPWSGPPPPYCSPKAQASDPRFLSLKGKESWLVCGVRCSKQ